MVKDWCNIMSTIKLNCNEFVKPVHRHAINIRVIEIVHKRGGSSEMLGVPKI